MLQKEVNAKNINYGISKSAEAVNEIDNIIYFGQSIVDFLERDFLHITMESNEDSIEEKLVQETFQMLNANSNLFLNLYVAHDGKVSSSTDLKYINSSPIGRPWYDLALKTSKMVITKPYKDLLTGEYVITISKQVKSGKQVIGLDIEQKRLIEVLKRNPSDYHGLEAGLVVNQEGVILASTKKDDFELPLIDDSGDEIKHLKPYLKEKLISNSGSIRFEQGKYSFVYQKSASNLYIIYVINKEFVSREDRIYRYQIFITSIILIISLNLIVLVYNYKKNKAISLKERAENAEQSLIEYKKNLEGLVLERTEEIRIQGEKLKEMNTAIIDHLGHIVEFRDLESGEHIKRIKIFVYILTKKVVEIYPEYTGLEEDIDVICNAAALHDMGKIGIPDSILLKPSKLTPEEFQHMKKHTVIGDELAVRILKKYDPILARYGHEICRYHHERYDGNGYPDGLKGEEIPMCAQIVGLADVYDALIEKRVYKKAYSHETAMNMIKNGECGVFSPKLIHCLELVEEEFIKVSQ